MADMNMSGVTLSTSGQHARRGISSEAATRRAARVKLAQQFGINPDVRTWTPEQIDFGRAHGFLPAHEAEQAMQHAPSVDNVAAEHQAGQELASLILATRANTPRKNLHTSTQATRKASDTQAALRMLGL